MENYIVRVYRRDLGNDDIAGIVEVVSTQEKHSFKSHDELIIILNMIRKPGAKIVWEPKLGCDSE